MDTISPVPQVSKTNKVFSFVLVGLAIILDVRYLSSAFSGAPLNDSDVGHVISSTITMVFLAFIGLQLIEKGKNKLGIPFLFIAGVIFYLLMIAYLQSL